MINAPHYSATGSKHHEAFALPDDPFVDLLTAARAGEEWAFNALFREWNPPLIRFLRARAPDAM